MTAQISPNRFNDNETSDSIFHNRPIKSLQIGGGWLPEQSGGMNRFYFDLLHQLPSAGVQCRGVVAGTPEDWPADAAVSVRAFAPLASSIAKRFSAERRMVKAELSQHQFDLAVAHFAPYAVPILGLLGELPKVIHFHGPWSQEAREEGAGGLACAAKAVIERFAYKSATQLIVLSDAFKSILIKDYSIRPERITVIPGGIDCDRFDISETRFEARRKLGWPTHRPIVIAVRRLARRMGLEKLIAAAVEIRRSIPDVLVLIAGSGKMRSELQATIDKLGLGETIRLLGFVPDPDLPLAYRAADLSVVPTVALEGFGLVAAESLASGTQALATPVGGLIELLGPLSQDLLFDGTSSDDIATGLIAALRGKLALPSAVDCVAYARRRFDWPIIAAKIGDVYRDVVAHHSGKYHLPYRVAITR